MQQSLTLTLLTSAYLLFFNLKDGYGQCNNSPCGFPDPQADPAVTCVVPNPTGLSCYIGNTNAQPSVVFPGWCGSNINTQWFAFTAIAPNVTFNIRVTECSSGNALQAGIFSSSDCINFTLVSNCAGNMIPPLGALVSAAGLTPGQVYYLCIGGSNGALCSYIINPPSWGGMAVNCVLNSLVGVPYTTTVIDPVWSVQPGGAAIFDNPYSNSPEITWLEPGDIELCVTSAICPLYCEKVEVAGGVFEEDHLLCQGQSVECAGHTYSAPGTYTITEPDGPWCFRTTHCNIHLVPTTYTTDTVFMCLNSSATCAGEEFFAPGSYPVKLTGYLGCDSIVTCKVNTYPASPVTNLTINMCGPAEYSLCNEVFNSSGAYTAICTNWHGCDSLINLNLAILDPQAIIALPDTLSCQNDTITLNGTASSANTAIGGTTLYQWSGPGIAGNSNSATVKVNLPGSYCLVLTHSRGGLICKDTACVQVVSSNLAPQAPQITGNFNPCKDSTYIYTATSGNATVPTSFTWTLPAGQPYTVLSPNSIQVTWSTVLSGTICVSAANACGSSQPACQQINVQTPVQPPVVNGPAAICANGGNYLFTLDAEEPGVVYNWTVPAGAVLTGSGDTVYVNFQNAVSGQVCVAPQNACGTGPAVCLNVQVNPSPTADLSSNAVICAGDSIGLNFSLTGNGPFDVVWSLGTLNDISNAYSINVSPSQTTVYSINSINDNSTTTCSSAVSDSVIVTVLPPVTTTVVAQICTGESWQAGGAAQTTSGVYTDSLSAVSGCDSTVVTTLTVFAIDTTTLQQNTCDPAMAGTATQILAQQNGCDSVIITLTTLQPSNTTALFATSCDPNAVGVFTQQLSNVYGCDSTVVTTVSFAMSDTTLLTAATCDPAAAGVFSNNLTGADGCDSLIITTVSLLPPDNTAVAATTCDPAAAGVFTTTLTNQYGCDSVVVTTVNLLASSSTALTATTCNLSEVGVFEEIFTNYLGCDSTVTKTVTFEPLPVTFASGNTCDPAAAGVFTDHFNSVNGCDSMVITTVSLLPSSTTALAASTCNPANAGVFTNVLTNYLGCDSTVITTVSFVPLPATAVSATTCNPASAGIFTDHFTTADGCDSTVVTTVNLLPASTTSLTGTTCNPANAGIFTEVLTNYLGCDSTVITTISLLPSDQTALSTTTCDPALAGVFVYPLINQFGCDSIVTETRSLLSGSMTTVNLTTCDDAQVGTTTTVLTNQFGCDSTVMVVTTLLPADNCSVAATLTGSEASCMANSGTLTLLPTVGIAPFSFTVLQGATVVTSGVAAAAGTPQVIGGLPAGSYTVNVSSPNGFSTTVQALVTQAAAPALTSAVISDYSGFNTSCEGAADGSASATATGGLPPYNFLWSNGSNSQEINGLAAGIYTVTVTDKNSCTNVAVTVLTEPDPLVMGFIINDLDCFDQNDGAIQATVSGGAPPYKYALNNGPVQSSNTFTGLKSGAYSLTVSDANDCQQTDAVVINAAYQLDVDLGDDITIGLGENATLQATVNIPLDSILSVEWSPGPFDSTECVEPCLTPTITPLVTTVYTIEVQSLNGCIDRDALTVFVDRRRQIYVPNVFTPNSDGANNLFSVFAKPGSVAKIHSLQVFDRWGDAVFLAKDFLPNDPSIGWNGVFKGKPVNPAVFVWVAEIEFIDGQREVFKGDVTVVR